MSLPRVRLTRRIDADNPEYKVGYCKPPPEHQFKPGQSGNPKGRPKGTRNLKTDLAEELAERIPVNENGRQKKLSKQRLMLKALVTRAIKGDTRAANTLIDLIARTIGFDQLEKAEQALSADDAALILDFLEHHNAIVDRADVEGSTDESSN
jgi:hypothetical protein